VSDLLPPTPDGIAAAATALSQDGLVCFPTDTIYALACVADSARARGRFYSAKERDPARAAIVMEPDAAALRAWVELDERAEVLAARHWPGPLTLVLPASDAAVEQLHSVVMRGTLAVRIPNYPAALALLRAVQRPLATSSANVTSASAPRTGAEALKTMGPRVAAVIDGECPLGKASSILDLTGPEPRIIREGAIPAARLLS
jgi:L-threonylcarbamoyladenylate synthase